MKNIDSILYYMFSTPLPILIYQRRHAMMPYPEVPTTAYSGVPYMREEILKPLLAGLDDIVDSIVTSLEDLWLEIKINKLAHTTIH